MQKKVKKAKKYFEQNPFHPSLRIHQLSGKMQGLWSISVDRQYRILFRILGEGDAFFISVGTHSVYK